MREGDVVEGRYELIRQIGRGGMGTVWEARHRTLDRTVALKLLHEELREQKDTVTRFINEAKAAAALGSSHFVDVLDAGEREDGTPYMVMELLEGDDLRHVLHRRFRLDAGHAAALISQVCDALALAHERGIVHRDLKPDNLFLTSSAAGRARRSAESGGGQSNQAETRIRVKILDFGIAKFRDLNLTPSQAVLGTLYYMAPEQAKMSRAVDNRTDIYALGAILYELLTGTRPHEADAFHELFHKILTETPAPPSHLRPELDAQLEAVVLRALERDPAERFQSAAELAEALEPFVDERGLQRLLDHTGTALAETQPPPNSPFAETEPMAEPKEQPGSPTLSPASAAKVVKPRSLRSVVWYSITLPFCWSSLVPAIYESPSMLTAFGPPADLPRWLALAFAVAVCLGLTVASVRIARFWQRLDPSRWLQGSLFIIFPGLGLLLLLRHLLKLDGQRESHLVALRSYASLTSTQATRTAEMFDNSYNEFLSALALDQIIICVLSVMILLGFVFLKLRRARVALGAHRRWLVIPAGLVLVAVTEVAIFPEHLAMMGPLRFVIYFLWILTVVGVLHNEGVCIEHRSMSWGALVAGIIACASFSGLHDVLGYIQALHFLGQTTTPLAEQQWLFNGEIHPLIVEGTFVIWGLLGLLFCALLIVSRSVLFRSRESSAEGERVQHALVVCVTVLIAAAPVPLLLTKMGNYGETWTCRTISQMRAISLALGQPPLFYIDPEPQSLHEGRRVLLARLTGTPISRYTDLALLAELAGGESCGAQLRRTLSAEDTLPARCLTAVEARLACEVLGKRLPTPEELEAAVGSGHPLEWTMEKVHGFLTYEVRGGDLDDSERRIGPNEVSQDVGFRCVVTFD